jgi:hypothetical protein
MSEERHQHEGLTPEELEEQNAELVPEREALTVIQPIAPIGGGFTLPVEPPDSYPEPETE